MRSLLVLAVLWLSADLASPNGEMFHELAKSGYSVFLCGGPGKDGQPGTNGTDGVRGEKGEPGQPGPQGVAGDPGPRGEQGIQGVAGPSGPRGEPGPPGPKGERGDSGSEVIETLQAQIAALNTKLTALQSSQERQKKAFTYFKGRATAGDKFYMSSGDQANYDEAVAICARAGGQLATPLSLAENNAVLTVRNQFDVHAFLGVNDIQTEGTFRYISGQPVTYTNWAPGEPNNQAGIEDCVEIYQDGKWNDKPCGEKRLVICQF